ncbi:MAG: T9SS type A sorting domain-containing protein [Crocinitomicaceae bacterium]|nr:T9SS type A sorting domain-containing protein [Crocinitomicaceae bacterium]
MTRIVSFFLLLTLTTGSVFSQGGPGSATTIPLTSYTGTLPVPTNYCLVTATQAATSTCITPDPTKVYWFKVTVLPGMATSALKIIVVPTGFDAVVDIYSNNGTVFMQCIDAASTGGTETLKTNYSTTPITPGDYHIRVSSKTGAANCFTLSAEYYPTAYIQYFPNPNPDAGMVGYSVTDNIKRNNTAVSFSPFVQGTRYHVYDAANPNTELCFGDLPGTTSQKVLNTFSAGCFCYGNSYIITTELKFDGIWTGPGPAKTINMEAYPNVTISNPPCQVLPMSGAISTNYLGSAQTLEFEFTTPGQSPIVQSVTGSSQVILQNVGCLQYNRIYSVRVRVKWCNVWGPWSAPYCLQTAPIPYLSITGSCPMTVGQYGTMSCNFIAGVNLYVWQFAEVNPSQPLIPIAPAILRNTATSVISLSSVPLTPGKSYRVAIKPRITTCGFNQEWDYGQFCMITVVPGTGMIILNEEDMFDHPEEKSDMEYSFNDSGALGVFSYSGDYSHRMLTVNTTGTNATGEGLIKIFNTSGQQVFTSGIYTDEENPITQTLLPSNLSGGIYIVSISTAGGSFTDKFFLTGQ